MRKILLCAFVVTVCLAMNASAAITTSAATANELAEAILGTGITISNVNYTGTLSASGTFTGGDASGIGFDEGIILTSGLASNAEGSNDSDSTSTNNGLAGNAALTALSGQPTYDASVLSFDFESAGGDVYFNYVFGSEEYNEWVDGYNDVFAFFVDGVNIALLPGTTTPVSINTVNLEDNSDLYNNNDPSDGTPTPFDFQYDGFTDVLTAVLLDLDAGTHTIELAIADGGDHALDGGVFIEAGTFSDVPTNPIPAPGAVSLTLLGIGCVRWFRRKNLVS